MNGRWSSRNFAFAISKGNDYDFNMSARSEVAVLERMIQPDIADVPADAARFFLSLDFSEADQARIDVLSAKAREDTMTDEDRAELNDFIHLGDFLALIQSKARRSLGKQATSAA